MTMGQAIGSVFSKYAVFGGRARRSEYWKFTLFNTVIGLAFLLLLTVSQKYFGGRMISAIRVLDLLYTLAVLLPGLAVCVRRLHDIGKSGWSYLMVLVPLAGPIILLVWMIRDGQPGGNAYGPNPKEEQAVCAHTAASEELPPAAPGTPTDVTEGGPRHEETDERPDRLPEEKTEVTPVVPSSVTPTVSVAGTRILAEVGQGGLLIGRNPDCGLVFPDETPGISGRHCAVFWDRETSEFIVKDLNSSFGTFLADGMRVAPDGIRRVKPGSSIFLGGPQNEELRLEIK
ncbi:MAG: DUF805 domain-containing protein [Oscillospiraceae bacterium]|nr:DUF805 domain-containing protein [Oscillospiraceae bacterium]